MGAGGAASTATVSVLAKRLHRTARNATRWAEARVQGIAADIRAYGGVASFCGVQLREIRRLIMSAILPAPASRSPSIVSREFPRIGMTWFTVF